MATQSNAHYHTVIPRWIHNLFFWRQCLFEVLLLPARKELVPVYESKFLTCQSGPHRRSPLGCQSCVLRGSTRTPCQLNCPMVYLGKKEHFSVGSRILTFKSRPYYSSTGCQAFISRGAPIEITHNKLETKKKKKWPASEVWILHICSIWYIVLKSVVEFCWWLYLVSTYWYSSLGLVLYLSTPLQLSWPWP